MLRFDCKGTHFSPHDESLRQNSMGTDTNLLLYVLKNSKLVCLNIAEKLEMSEEICFFSHLFVPLHRGMLCTAPIWRKIET